MCGDLAYCVNTDYLGFAACPCNFDTCNSAFETVIQTFMFISHDIIFSVTAPTVLYADFVAAWSTVMNTDRFDLQ